MQIDAPTKDRMRDESAGNGLPTMAIAAAAIAAGGLLIWWGWRAIRERTLVVGEIHEEGFSERYVMEELWTTRGR